jgi:hypothetical protein
MSTTKKLLLGTTAGILALAAAALPASAKGGHHHHHFRSFYGPAVVASAPTGCDYYRWKWRQTGAWAWKSRYFACIG